MTHNEESSSKIKLDKSMKITYHQSTCTKNTIKCDVKFRNRGAFTSERQKSSSEASQAPSSECEEDFLRKKRTILTPKAINVERI